MSDDQPLIRALFEKYASGTASPEEVKQLFSLISDQQFDQEMKNLLLGELQQTELPGEYDTERWNRVFKQVKAETELLEYKGQSKRIFGFRRLAVAASIIAVLATGAYFYLHSIKPAETTQLAKNDVVPGRVSATLTLANGRQIKLSAANIGLVAWQAGASISKTTNGKIVYQAQNAGSTVPLMNTLTTGRGETYQVDLPDGSKVWLNAASSIKYPVAFTGTERRIELTGEAYFEVVHNNKQLFRVVTNKQVVEDVGTHFNINSYSDEPATKTTLLEGAVKVNETLLRPGEQATLSPSGKISITQTDADEAIAWKNGKFVFDREDIPGIMRKLARWYDVQVSYSGDFSGKTFTGSISRFDDISKILDKITYTSDIHFQIEGRRIAVSR